MLCVFSHTRENKVTIQLRCFVISSVTWVRYIDKSSTLLTKSYFRPGQFAFGCTRRFVFDLVKDPRHACLLVSQLIINNRSNKSYTSIFIINLFLCFVSVNSKGIFSISYG